MKENYIELTELIFDIATNPYNHSSLNLHQREDLPPGYKGRIKVRHADGTIIDDNRFEYNYYIFPNVLSNISRMLNQAMQSEYGYQLFEYDFDQEIIIPANNPEYVLEKVKNILTYAVKHDCFNYDHFWNADGKITEMIYLKKSEARFFLDGNHIKYSSRIDETSNVRDNKQQFEYQKELCDRLKRENQDEIAITIKLLDEFKGITNHRLGKLVRPSPTPEEIKSKDPVSLYQGRGKILRNMALLKKVNKLVAVDKDDSV